MRKEFTVQSRMIIAGEEPATVAAVAIVISGQCTTEYWIWNDTTSENQRTKQYCALISALS